jgi:NhaA family Na+:H+ antiporter
VFGPQHPAIPFLLLLAIADDALGLVILALFYPTGAVNPGLFAVLFFPALIAGWALRRLGVVSFWPYVLLAGGISWFALFRGGFHPALALVPVLPFMPHEKRDLGLFHPREVDLPYTMNRFEHWWKTPVQFVLFFFGLVNAGVPVASVGPGTWAVLVGLLAGKPIGIALCTLGAGLVGLSRPTGLRARDVVVLGFAAGIGFTVSLFFATAAFPPGGALDHAKMGALLSFTAAPLAIVLGRMVGTRRVAP